MTRSLRDALGEALRTYDFEQVAKDLPWDELNPTLAESWRESADRLLAIAATLGITITMGGAPENTER